MINLLTPKSKPPLSDPCNGCGFCCIMEQCRVSVDLFGKHGRCPALEWNEKETRFYCGLMRAPEQYPANHPFTGEDAPLNASYYRHLIGAGIGCDSTTLAKGEEAPPAEIPDHYNLDQETADMTAAFYEEMENNG